MDAFLGLSAFLAAFAFLAGAAEDFDPVAVEGFGAVAVEDLGSSNGTFLRITSEADVRTGDVLLMGQQLFRIAM